MKIALVQDQLLTPAGSERVFLYMVQEFQDADIYTLCYNPINTWPEFKALNVRVSLLNRFIQTHSRFKMLFPLSTYFMQIWDFSKYDLIITSSATTAKYIKKYTGKHICYCYLPTRAIWSHNSYFGDSTNIKIKIFKAILWFLKKRDFAAAKRVDKFISISQSSAEAIKSIYGRDSLVLFCPIDFDRFKLGVTMHKKDYFLIVSRLEKWKLIDYAVEAFNILGLPLKIIGSGEESAHLRSIAAPNISFLGSVDDETLVRYYGEARAVVFTPELEYGLVPLEANAAGTPVIALGRRGVLETMVGLDDASGRKATAVLYPDPTSVCLIDAVIKFQSSNFIQEDLLFHASKFSIGSFQKNLRNIINDFVEQPT
jgi:glycosyltransferase involved in cell wall biosynthesis